MEYLDRYINWLIQHAQWFFSGIGVFILGLLFIREQKKRNKFKQKSGENSTNIQVGGDYVQKK